MIDTKNLTRTDKTKNQIIKYRHEIENNQIN